MTKKNIPSPETTTGTLVHSPFAGLGSRVGCADLPAKPHPPVVKRVLPTKPLPPRKVSLRLESTGRGGKVVTRISGLPNENLEAIASRLRKALGCGAIVEKEDVLLLGTLADRASQWLDRAGDLRAIKSEQATIGPPDSSSNTAQHTASTTSGTKRSEVRPGQRVAIVMKADQTSGTLTEGIVRDLLTSSATHPRGIKVRLVSGEVGRVKVVYG